MAHKITNMWKLKNEEEKISFNDMNNVRFKIKHGESKVQYQKDQFDPE